MKYVFVVTTVLILGWVVNSIRLAGSRAEHGLHAMRVVTRAVQEYVQDCGEWPASWEELETVGATDGSMIYSWPRDSGELQRYVEIDFDRTLEDVANESPDHFDAIRPSGPTYQGYREYVVALLATIREEIANGTVDSQR